MSTETGLSDIELTDLAVDLTIAMMRSASTDKISPADWWPRAKSALETASATAESFPHLISRMGRKLQLTQTRFETDSSVSSIGQRLSRDADFRRFCVLARRDALFIVAMAKVKRDEQRQEDQFGPGF